MLLLIDPLLTNRVPWEEIHGLLIPILETVTKFQGTGLLGLRVPSRLEVETSPDMKWIKSSMRNSMTFGNRLLTAKKMTF